ncbi:hypothetical protein SVIO_036400 [Streptomyces violaceusniger]|uniref:Uncharacterized protein n=1 Tax=Streptomyces violaceusniger TaxID=68280 RepID=A0A4D4L2U3_STRVO|nr:hypothetical protein SVIO_036400 [Streptomyces violaceusniger]
MRRPSALYVPSSGFPLAGRNLVPASAGLLSLAAARRPDTGAGHRPGVYLAPPPRIALWLGDRVAARLGRGPAGF